MKRYVLIPFSSPFPWILNKNAFLNLEIGGKQSKESSKGTKKRLSQNKIKSLDINDSQKLRKEKKKTQQNLPDHHSNVMYPKEKEGENNKKTKKTKQNINKKKKKNCSDKDCQLPVDSVMPSCGRKQQKECGKRKAIKPCLG